MPNRSRQDKRSQRLEHITEIVFDDGTTETLGEWWTDYTREGSGRSNFGFFMVPNLFLRSTIGVGPQAWHILMVLMSWMLRGDPGRPIKRVSIANLMEWTDYSRSTVLRAIERLEDVGFLTVQHVDSRNNWYRINIDRVVIVAEELVRPREGGV